MLDKIRLFKVNHNDVGLYYEFDLGRFVKEIIITTKNNTAYSSNKEIKIKYAQNGITTDLIEAEEQIVYNENKIKISFETPLSATHVYFVTDMDLSCDDIEIYEELKESITNYYPINFDKDLGENYWINSVNVFTNEKGFSHYSIFTSLDGSNYSLLATKQNDNPCDMLTGDVFSGFKVEARFIRVYIEYNSDSPEAILKEVRFTGEKSGTPIRYAQKINIPRFEESEFNKPITEEDVYKEVYGIVTRTIGEEYTTWFDFEISPNPKNSTYDYFELTNANNNKILICGNNGVSLAVGLNHYLKYYCNINISQLGNQIKMPLEPIKIKGKIFKETKAKVRYAYNYCTHSYTMAFWGEEEWRKEIDWLALNGVNLVLDITAQEEVWRRFLTKIGYTHEEIKSHLTGPAYFAWAYMANMSKYGGPLHDSWFEKRTDLARKNQRIMKTLGMNAVLQGYCGLVPADILKHDKNADIILQGTWCSFDRPPMLRTTSECFARYSKMFYEAQCEVYGNISNYFATDPFHEGGNMSDMSAREVSTLVLKQMLNYNEDAVWVIQSWMSNPSSELLAGIGDVNNGRNHALILDLYAEKQPNYNKGYKDNPDHGYSPEFDSTPWVFCMLNNFGGRCGLHGHIDNLANWIPQVFNSCKYISGIGITSESTYCNPVLYDFLFELVWQDDVKCDMQTIDLKNWVHKYSERRYGIKSAALSKAWDILINTVYKAEFNMSGQGGADVISNSKPALQVRAASSWGNGSVMYDKQLLIEAGKLLIEEYSNLKNNQGYVWDVVSVFQQILANRSQDVQLELAEAFTNNNVIEFSKLAEKFLKIFDIMDNLLLHSEFSTLARWLKLARKLSADMDEFTQMLFTINAKAQLTTWGSIEQCEIGGLRDYANKQWAGLEKDFYKGRWQLWINERIKELNGENFMDKINWFDFEWRWVRNNKLYSEEIEKLNLIEIANKILTL